MPSQLEIIQQLIADRQRLNRHLFGDAPQWGVTDTPNGGMRIEPNSMVDTTSTGNQLLPMVEYMKAIGINPLVPNPGEIFDQNTLRWWLDRKMQNQYPYQTLPGKVG